MERIPHRELRNSSSEILRRVAAGEVFEITNHGEVVAVLRPPGNDDLWESELLKPAAAVAPWEHLKRHKVLDTTGAVLDVLREERR
ncbi:type II toxin-antitoxin system Phd/YefM family antitoxin [Nocardioides limicola]|uniref:type II toxin-antitoxin system Phd/YefM family antitoxin n=1 Tax=Nocardioides limicola TaxID=2803368 RepID=UPI00193B12C8|nr:type II toxin-antitoxin system prevent-host-death family antitoxin [Nocardioides sp. DJM-14]